MTAFDFGAPAAGSRREKVVEVFRLGTFGRGTEFRLTVGTLFSLFERTPRLVYRHVRDAVGGAMGAHRRSFLSNTKVEFGDRQGLYARKLDSRPNTAQATFGERRAFFYKVFPDRKTIPKGSAVTLDDIRGEAYTGSKVALGLEVGGVFRGKSGKGLIAIPIGITRDSSGRVKGTWATPKLFRQASANNQLVAIRYRRWPRLYQVRKGGSRKVAAAPGAFTPISARPQGRQRSASRILIPAYQLVPLVRRRKLLGFLDSWDRLEGDRTRRFRAALDNVVRDIDDGKQA